MNDNIDIDAYLVNDQEQRLKATSFGGQVLSKAEGEKEHAIQVEANENVGALYDQGKLSNDNVKKDDYNFTEMYKEQGGFGDDAEGMVLPNKFRAPLKQEVAGYDLGTTRQERKKYEDGDGVVRKAVEQLTGSYADLTNGRPVEDAFPLSQIAYQAMKEGKDADYFKKSVDGWPEEVKEQAWRSAQRVDDANAYREYVESGVWNTKDNQPKKLPPIKHDDLVKDKEWLNAAYTYFVKAYGEQKEGVPLTAESLNKQALMQMSMFNHNLTAQSAMVSRVMNSNDPQLKQAFYNMMEMYDRIDITDNTMEYFKRGATSMLTDPVNVVGGGVASKIYKSLAGKQIGSRAFAPILAASMATGTEAGTVGGLLEFGKERTKVGAGVQDKVDVGNVASKAAGDAAMGAALPFAIAGGAKGLKGVAAGTNSVVNRMREVASEPSFFSSGSKMDKQRGNVAPMGQEIDMPPIVDPFYSRMERSLESAIGRKGGTPEQLMSRVNSMANKGMFKREELEWSGLSEYLESKPKGERIDKEQLMNALKSRNYQLEEKRLGGVEPVDREAALLADDSFDEGETLTGRANYEHRIDDIEYDAENYGFDPSEAENLARKEYPDMDDDEIATEVANARGQFAEEYAESEYMDNPEYEHTFDDINVTVTGNDDMGYHVYDSFKGRPADREFYSTDDVKNYLNEEYYDELMENAGAGSSDAKYQDYALEGGENYREILFKGTGEKSTEFNLRTAHYDEPNVLFHVRAQDFMLPDGSKTLYVDEVQSDWHNSGKEYGYVGPQLDKTMKKNQQTIDENKPAINDLMSSGTWKRDLYNNEVFIKGDIEQAMKKVSGNVSGARSLTELFESDGDVKDLIRILPQAKEIMSKLPKTFLTDYGDFSKLIKKKLDSWNAEKSLYNQKNAVSVAPLKDDYPVTAMRRMVREAADDGYDSISWSTSELQAERWSESFKKLYELVYDKKMKKEADRLAKKFGGTVSKQVIKTDFGPVEVWNLDLSPALKDSAKHEGFPLFQMGAGLGTATAASQMSEDNDDQQL